MNQTVDEMKDPDLLGTGIGEQVTDVDVQSYFLKRIKNIFKQRQLAFGNIGRYTLRLLSDYLG